MKRLFIAALMSAFIAAPAFAAGEKNSVGINYGFDQSGVIGLQGEFDISSHVNKAPVSIQVFWKGYSESFVSGAGNYKFSYNGFGAAGIYDFGSVVKQNNKIRPFVGLGLVSLNSSYSGPAGLNVSSDSGGLYVAFGAKYVVSPEVSADLSYNNVGGLTIGANYHF